MTLIRPGALLIFIHTLFLTACLNGSQTMVTLGSDLSIPVRISKKTDQANPTQVTPIAFDVVFNQEIDVSTFTPGKVENAGTANVSEWSVEGGQDGRTFTLKAVTISAPGGTVSPRISAGQVLTKGGSFNAASTGIDVEVNYDVIPPSKPVQVSLIRQAPILDATVLPSAPGVTWSANVSDARSFEAEILASSDNSIVEGWTAIKSGGSITSSNLAWDKEYRYRIRAIDAAGNVSDMVDSAPFHLEHNNRTLVEPLGLPDMPNTGATVCSSSDLIFAYYYTFDGHLEWPIFKNAGNGWVQMQLMQAPADVPNSGSFVCKVVGDRILVAMPGWALYVLQKNAITGQFYIASTTSIGSFMDLLPMGNGRVALLQAGDSGHDIEVYAETAPSGQPWVLESTLTGPDPNNLSDFGIFAAYANGKLFVGYTDSTPVVMTYQLVASQWVNVDQIQVDIGGSYYGMAASGSDLVFLSENTVTRYSQVNGVWQQILSFQHQLIIAGPVVLAVDQDSLMIEVFSGLMRGTFSANGTVFNLVQDFNADGITDSNSLLVSFSHVKGHTAFLDQQGLHIITH